jgi:hypothetical protein
VNILLDTYAFLWAITEDAQFSVRARQIFTARTSELFLAASSLHFDEYCPNTGDTEEGWPLLSADPLLARYPAELIW